mmetsp:Transcript_8753/g.6492  ORF Transcript_8753/g.6492 Transcript_8753/m.6492 type:complete len:182 (-) Transcript_8753:482-1027(-)
MRTYEIDQVLYWKHEFTAACSRDRLTEFVVINIENLPGSDLNISRAAAKEKFKMVQVELQRADDYGKNDKTFIVSTHLGEVVNYNDTLLCYDLSSMTLTGLEELELKKKFVPEIVTVRKTYPKYRKRQKQRLWKLKELNKEALEESMHGGKADKKGIIGQKAARDKEMFCRDVEEDLELRQ